VTSEVWRANLLVLAQALLVGAAAWLLLRGILGARGRRAGRIWHAAGHPALVIALTIFVAAAPIASRSLRGGEHPSVILVSLDTLRADHLSAYGYPRETSPALDRLAAEGILFENAVAPAPNTPPSHMSIFTSLYPTVHGFTGEGDRLAGWRLTLAEYLREAGYRTAATTDGGYMRGWFGFGQGFERYEDSLKGIAASRDLVLEWLDGPLAGDPTFLFIHCYDVHSPYDAPPPYGTMFTDPDYDGGFYPGSRQLEAIRRRLAEDPTATHGLTEADVAHMIDRYDGGIRYVDAIIGELVAALEVRGLLETTWLVVTSDHGEEFTEHGSVLHETLYRTVTHVPLIVRPPGGREAPLRVPHVVELTDLMPTILEIASIDAVEKQPLQGASLLAFAFGMEPERWKNVAFSEHPWRGRRRAIMREDVHVLTSLDHGELEAYAYPIDPLEQNDLGTVTAHGDSALARLEATLGAGGAGSVVPADTLRAAMRALFRWSDVQIGIASTQRGGTESLTLDESAVEELRALGYLQ
jgi:arylsulfatase